LNLSRATSELPIVTNLLARRAGVLVTAAAVGALVASPALADVTVSPTTAAQGTGENFTFHVTNTGKLPIGTVTLKLPSDTAIAEVYPLSVDDWAPKIDMAKTSTPLTSIHGTPQDEITRAIIWIAMPGLALAPGKSTDLTIALGPLPDVSSIRLTIATTYTNGQAGPSQSPAVALTPATAQQLSDAHAGHNDTSTGGTGDATSSDDATFAQVVADATRGPSLLSIAGWVVAALALLGGVVMMLRSRHRAEEDDEPEDEDANAMTEKASVEGDDKEPVTAGSSKWSFKG
jgi:hypothetical protein